MKSRSIVSKEEEKKNVCIKNRIKWRKHFYGKNEQKIGEEKIYGCDSN